MSYIYYLRSNKGINNEINRKLGRDGVTPRNAEIFVEEFIDNTSNYKFNYYLYIEEFNLPIKDKNNQKLRMSEKLNKLIKDNWKNNSEISIEIIWESRKLSKPPKKVKIDVDYRLLNSGLILSFFSLDNIDVGVLKIINP